jgi:fimbrial isopeptide formation D2 family protein
METCITVDYSVNVTDELKEGDEIVNLFVAPTRPNTNGDLIKDDPGIPSGGDEDTKIVYTKNEDTPLLQIDKKAEQKVYKLGEDIPYTLRVTSNGKIPAKNVVITDKLETPGVAYNDDTIKVMYDSDDITTDCSIKVNARNFIIETHRDLLTPSAITVTYTAHISDEPDAYKSDRVDNYATADADNTQKVDDKDQVPTEDFSDAQRVKIVKKSDKKVYEVGETVNYTLEATLAAGRLAKNAVISDEIATAGVRLESDSISVAFNGEDITSGCAITVSGAAFRAETGKNLSSKDKLTVTYRAVIEDAQLAGKQVDNISVITTDNTPPDDSPNTVEVGPKAFLKITKESDKTVYEKGDVAKYTLVVTNPSKVEAINVSVTDSLKTNGVTLVKGSEKVMFCGADITMSCEIQDNAKGFTVATHKNLAAGGGESITVTYDVKIPKDFKGQRIDNIATAWGDNTPPADSPNAARAKHSVTVDKPDKKPEQPAQPKQPKQPKQPGGGLPWGGIKTGEAMTGALAALLLAGAAAAAILLRRRFAGRNKRA